MATPLANLLRSVLTDETVRLAAGRSPSAFLRDHGWEHLDAADLREAMLVLADGAPTSEAALWVGGSDAIDPEADLADALTAATAEFPSQLVADDPSALDDAHLDGDHTHTDTATDDDIDDREPDAADHADHEADTEGAENIGPGHGDDDDAGDDVGEPGMPIAPADEPFDVIQLDEPEQFADPDDAPPTDDTPAPGEVGDGWDDLI